jgi:3-deoxy-D-manno-octulosonic acid kinase
MMTKDGGRRIDTSTGAVLADPDRLAPAADVALESLFEPAYWACRGKLAEAAAGRGSAWFISTAPQEWVLRHYRRGGFIARLSTDRYAWQGEQRVRAFAEWRILGELARRGLPVPRPVAARYQRSGLLYRCDLITERIPDARPLSALLASAPVAEHTWQEVGAAVARLHAAGADHADLNAHNILVNSSGAVSVIDFDRGRLRSPGAWVHGNLARLRRSLAKVTRRLPADRYSAAAWHWVLAGYARSPP